MSQVLPLHPEVTQLQYSSLRTNPRETANDGNDLHCSAAKCALIAFGILSSIASFVSLPPVVALTYTAVVTILVIKLLSCCRNSLNHRAYQSSRYTSYPQHAYRPLYSQGNNYGSARSYEGSYTDINGRGNMNSTAFRPQPTHVHPGQGHPQPPQPQPTHIHAAPTAHPALPTQPPHVHPSQGHPQPTHAPTPTVPPTLPPQPPHIYPGQGHSQPTHAPTPTVPPTLPPQPPHIYPGQGHSQPTHAPTPTVPPTLPPQPTHVAPNHGHIPGGR